MHPQLLPPDSLQVAQGRHLARLKRQPAHGPATIPLAGIAPAEPQDKHDEPRHDGRADEPRPIEQQLAPQEWGVDGVADVENARHAALLVNLNLLERVDNRQGEIGHGDHGAVGGQQERNWRDILQPGVERREQVAERALHEVPAEQSVGPDRLYHLDMARQSVGQRQKARLCSLGHLD